MKNLQDMELLLTRLVNVQRESSELIGLGAVIIKSGEIIGPSVSGERKKGSKVSLSEKDQWHIGSVTKSFTATMIARLIERGKLGWSTSVKEVYSDINLIHVEWQNVTLEQLLTHTSGAPSNFSYFDSFKKPIEGIDRFNARERAVLKILGKVPKNAPGTTFMYSNIGYTIAGAMAEKVTGVSWESLIRQEVFTPLKIHSGGFGPPQDKEKKLSQPQGHHNLFGIKFAAGTQDDNSPIIGPAGSIHLSLEDLALYANEHLLGAKGKGTLLTRKSFQRLHNPIMDNYACGWVDELPKGLTAGSGLWHNGSNNLWYALLVILPDIDTVIAVTSNDGCIENADKCAWKIIEQLSKELTV
ncbi:serine hydrolase domain-containing protein [Pleionea mediterranea]|uniref:CubicO group peptidase (Beta-lactamase class C family) n=1 Tax=Pleionea mediterranea TaxID=523701 RepID=A0A316G051_9GAMM|nr:serine hydrolase domain-containing protein [Pleionea mediterranea]PWK53180.1 CubicO group peptidase (beta-lactamase class C family) [Pleionea mediterranea]